ncbi:MAG: type IV conjugative transfer system lipoprotein TraV [Desulfobacterales bacterium]|nr:type IV conjugative transfer system lipoprotein TraV [Desulfobacterales bacterium]
MIKKLSLIIFIAFMLNSCASVFNPYKDEFQCPETDKGKCTSLKKAYDESLEKKKTLKTKNTDKDKNIKKNNDKTFVKEKTESEFADDTDETIKAYETKRAELLNKIIQSDAPPIVVPPEVARILILPYTSENNTMFGLRYVYFFIGNPEWVLSNSEQNFNQSNQP